MEKMMKKITLMLATVSILGLIGCGGPKLDERTEAEKRAAEAPAITDPSQLPADMPPQARAAAEAAMNQRKAQMEAQKQQAAAAAAASGQK